MITEDYVSRETYELLKEKGYDGEFKTCYDMEGYTCPTIHLYDAMKWLREERDVGIFPSVATYTDGDKIINGYRTIVVTLKNRITKSYHYAKTHEEACEAAIKYCLENLI